MKKEKLNNNEKLGKEGMKRVKNPLKVNGILSIAFLLFGIMLFVNTAFSLTIGNGTTLYDGCYTYNATVNVTMISLNISSCTILIDGIDFCVWQNRSLFTTNRFCTSAITLINPLNNTVSYNYTYNFTENFSGANFSNYTLNIYNNVTGALSNQTTVSLGGVTIGTVGIMVSMIAGIYNWFYSMIDVYAGSVISGNNTLTVNGISSLVLNATSTQNLTTDNLTVWTIGVYPANVSIQYDWYKNNNLFLTNYGNSTNNINLSNCYINAGDILFVNATPYQTINSLAWNISTASYSQNKSTQFSSPNQIFIRPDGRMMFVAELNSTIYSVNEYDLSTPWNVSTAVFIQNKTISSYNGISFSPDGKVMIISTTSLLIKYSLSSPWNISTAVNTVNATVGANRRGIFFSSDGLRFYTMDNSYANGNLTYQYSLSTPWDITTITLVANKSIQSVGATYYNGFWHISPDGTNMFYTSSDNTNQTLFRYLLLTPWDITTGIYVQNYSLTNMTTYGGTFKPDGSKFYAVNFGNGTISQYNMNLTNSFGTAVMSNNITIISYPNVTLNTPINNTGTILNTINFTANVSDYVNVTNVTLFIYNTSNGNLYFNSTQTVGVSQSTVGIVVILANGIYNWFYSVIDISSQQSYSLVNYTLTLNGISSFVLNSSYGTNYSNENLTAYPTLFIPNSSIKYIYNWYKGDTPLSAPRPVIIFNMPFDGGTLGKNSTCTNCLIKDYALGNNGTPVNSVYNSTGGFDGKGAYEFNGTAIQVTGVMIINSSMTFSAWVKHRGLYSSPSTQHVIGGVGGTLNDGLLFNNSGSFGIYDCGNSSNNMYWAFSNQALDSNWHYIAATINNSLYFNLYLDGNLIKSDVCLNAPKTFNLSFIGGYGAGTGQKFNGTIDEVTIWNRSLSSAEISALYNSYFTNKSNNVMVSQELTPGDNWSVFGTPNDNTQDGNSIMSNNLTIQIIYPNVSLKSPANNAYSFNASYNFTANVSDIANLANATLYIYNYSGEYAQEFFNESMINVSSATTSAYSNFSGYPSSMAVDRIINSNNGWLSANTTMPQWWAINFSNSTAFTRIKIYVLPDNQNIMGNYSIQYWNGTSYVNFAQSEINGGDINVIYDFNRVNTTSVRVWIAQGKQNGYAYIQEIEFYNYYHNPYSSSINVGALQSTVGIVVTLANGIYQWFYSVTNIFNLQTNSSQNIILCN